MDTNQNYIHDAIKGTKNSELKLLFSLESFFFPFHTQIKTSENRVLRRSGCKMQEVTDGRKKLHTELWFILFIYN